MKRSYITVPLEGKETPLTDVARDNHATYAFLVLVPSYPGINM